MQPKVAHYYKSSFVCVRPAGRHTGVTLMSHIPGWTVTRCHGGLKVEGSTFLGALSSISMSVLFHEPRTPFNPRSTLCDRVSRSCHALSSHRGGGVAGSNPGAAIFDLRLHSRPFGVLLVNTSTGPYTGNASGPSVVECSRRMRIALHGHNGGRLVIPVGADDVTITWCVCVCVSVL